RAPSPARVSTGARARSRRRPTSCSQAPTNPRSAPRFAPEWSNRAGASASWWTTTRSRSWAGTERGWGIAVVCGAGINGLGRAPDGREVRFLSLGEVSGDWGGGEDVGLAALAAAARSVDGRGPRTVLETAVPAHFGLSDTPAVSRAVFLNEI